MQDVELMHMRYALESAVFALGAMGRSVTDVKESHQMALYYLKDLRNHLEAINNIPRKVERALNSLNLFYSKFLLDCSDSSAFRFIM